MKFASKLLVAILTFIVLTGAAFAQSDDPNRTSSPTVIGATGLFTVFDATTLKRGEYNISFFFNNFKRDPGSVHIQNIPVNATIGVGRLELFFNIDLDQQITVRRPDALSGFLLPQNVAPGTSFGFSQTNGIFAFNGPPFLVGASQGGILPGIPIAGTARPILVQSPTGLDLRFPFPSQVAVPGYGPFCNPVADPNCRVRVNPVPLFLFPLDILGFQGQTASYLNNYPFLGRTNGNGLGNVTAGGKFRLSHEDSKLQFAVLGLVRIPTIDGDTLFTSSGLLRGRGAGAIDVGGYLIMSTHIRSATLSANIGYMHDGSPNVNGTEVLNRADELHSGVGLSLPFKKHFQFVTELTDEAYVGGHTPNLFQKNPLEYRVGLRFFPRNWIQVGATYQVLLNQFSDTDTIAKPFVNVNVTDQIVTALRPVSSSDPHGFMAYISFGHRLSEKPVIVVPPAINHEPAVTCSGSTSSVTRGSGSSVITFSARGTDQDNDVLTYSWNASGGASISGSGTEVRVDTANLPAGSYSVSVTVDDGHQHTANCSASFTVTEKPNNCPVVTQVTADPTSVEFGTNTRVTLRATASDADGDRLTYQWSTDKGSVSGSGDTVTLDTTGLGAGTATVSVTVSDGKCQGSGSASVTIIGKSAPPVSAVVGNCITYPARNVTRADNVCKGVLEDVSGKLAQDPRATLYIQGYADANEKTSAAQTRAEQVRDFLVTQKHIDANRIKIVALGSKASPNAVGGNNRIVTIWIVPEGASEPQF